MDTDDTGVPQAPARPDAASRLGRRDRTPDVEETVLQPAPWPAANPPHADHDELTVLRGAPTAQSDGPAPARSVAAGAPPPTPTGSTNGTPTAPWLRDPTEATAPPPERYAPPPEPGAGQRRWSRASLQRSPRRLVGPALALVALLVAGGLLVRHPWSEQGRVDPAAVVSPARSQAPLPQAHGRSDDVVRDYLTSLARGDVAHAISLGQDQGSGVRDLLSPSVYDAARAWAPITDIQVPAQAADTTSVMASYHVGQREVHTTFEMHRTPDLTWQLARSVASVTFSPSSVPLLVAGHAVRPGHAYAVLPGAYQVTTGQAMLVYPATDELDVDSTSASLSPTAHVQFATGAEAAVQDAVEQGLQACGNALTAAPPNCPFGFSPSQPGDRLVAVTWQLDPSASRDVAVALDASSATAIAHVRVSATMSADEVAADGHPHKGESGSAHVSQSTGALDCQVSVPLRDARPDHLQPSFSPSQCVAGR